MTETPQVDAALRQAAEHDPEMFEHAPEIIYTHDLEGNLVAFSRSAERITGYSREELGGMHFGSVVAPEYRDLARQMILRKLAGDPVTIYELEIVRKDGERVPLEISSWLVKVDGRPVGIQGIARDITERRKIEASVQESERRFRALIENSTDAIMLWSRQGRVVYAAPSVERVLGYSEPEVAGRIALELVHPDDADQAGRLWVEVMKAPGNQAGGLFRVRHNDGSWRWIEGVGKNLLDQPGVGAIVATFRDVTERIRTQQELQDSVRLLESAYADRRALMARLVNAQEEERERIAQDIHDDSIQGLTAALIRLEMLRNHLADPKQLEITDQLVADVRRCISGLRGLIFEVHPHALDEYGLVAAIRQILERARHQTGVEFDVAGALPEEPSSESRQIMFRIAQEAVTNILKHARARRIDVTVDAIEDGCRIRIRDDGAGLASAARASATTEPEPGHLGLAGMRARAHSSGGWWRMESEPERGTLVEYWIPNVRPHSAAEPSRS
ncbi:MAG: PAS domain S-box protein [Actinomycetota bacterium]